MNTANPQLEGLYLAIAAMNRLMVEKQLLTHEEIRETLREVEDMVLEEPQPQTVSDSHRKAVAFPIRLLIMADEAAEKGADVTFDELARHVGRSN